MKHESQSNYAVWKEPVSKITCCIILFIWYSQKDKIIVMETDQWLMRVMCRRREWLRRDNLRSSGDDKTILYPDCSGTLHVFIHVLKFIELYIPKESILYMLTWKNKMLSSQITISIYIITITRAHFPLKREMKQRRK